MHGHVRLVRSRKRLKAREANIIGLRVHRFAVVKEVEAMAADKGCTPAQLALAWVLAQGDDVVPIPGTKRRTYLEDNLGAADVLLSDDDLRRIDAIMPPGAAEGQRYADMAGVNR